MKLNKITVFIALLCLSFSGVSQEKIFLDENLREIDSINLYQKCKQQPFKCLEYKKDSLIHYTVLYKHAFGKLSKTEYAQIKSILEKDANQKINSNSVLIIKYYDSIWSFKKVYKDYLQHVKEYNILKSKDSTKNTSNTYHAKHDFNEEKFEINRTKWIKSRNKCKEKFEKKYPTQIFHMYKSDSNISSEYKNFKWVKDRGIFKNIFFKITQNYSTIFIKPDGEYFLNGTHFSDRNAKLLLKKNDWGKFKNDWSETVKNFKMEGKGMFEKDANTSHKKHCF